MLKTFGTYLAYYIGAGLLTLLISHFASTSLPADFRGGLQGLIGFCILWIAHRQAQEAVKAQLQQEQQEQTA
jgi:hypothetical protein